MRTVKCPTCHRPTVFDPANKYRPFCSERCQTLDLGAWADEQFRIPAENQEIDVNKNSEELSSDDAKEESEHLMH